MSSCRVTDNSAGSRGGGVHVDGISSSTFQNCEFTNNSAVDGGALVVDGILLLDLALRHPHEEGADELIRDLLEYREVGYGLNVAKRLV